jgi:5-methylthioadenosine/S-adenosylhomocysteine deaminase
MFETMKICALLHKAHRWDPTVLQAQKTLDLATIEAARALGVDQEIGSIEPEKIADIILLDANTPNLSPVHGAETVVSDLVYSASSGNVNTTIVDGRVLMENKIITSLDTAAICAKSQELAARLLS